MVNLNQGASEFEILETRDFVHQGVAECLVLQHVAKCVCGDEWYHKLVALCLVVVQRRFWTDIVGLATDMSRRLDSTRVEPAAIDLEDVGLSFWEAKQLSKPFFPPSFT